MTPFEHALTEFELAYPSDKETALAWYEKAIEAARDDGLRAATCVAAAALCQRLGRFDQVHELCDEALAGPFSDLLRGKVMLVSSDAAEEPEEAIERYARAVELLLRDPDGHPWVRHAAHRAAKWCTELNRWEEADRWIARGLESARAPEAAHQRHSLLRSRACMMIDHARYAEAAAAVRECLALAVDPALRELDRSLLVSILVANGQPEEAIPFAENRREVAMLLFQAGRLDEADQAFAAELERTIELTKHPRSPGACAVRAAWAAVKEARGEMREAEALRAELTDQWGGDATFDPKWQFLVNVDQYRQRRIDASIDPAFPFAVAVELWRGVAPDHWHLAYVALLLIRVLPNRPSISEGKHEQVHELYRLSTRIWAEGPSSPDRLQLLCEAAEFDAIHGYFADALRFLQSALADYVELSSNEFLENLARAASALIVRHDSHECMHAPNLRQLHEAREVLANIWTLTGDAPEIDVELRSSLLHTRVQLAEEVGALADAVRLHAEWMELWDLDRGDRFDALRRRLDLLARAGGSDPAAADECRRLQHEFADEAFAQARTDPSPVARLLPALRDYVRVQNTIRGDIVFLVDMPTSLVRTIGNQLGASFIDDAVSLAPAPRELLAATEPFANETTFRGYVVLPPREDARITLDAVSTPTTDLVRAWKNSAAQFKELGSRITCSWD